MKSKGNALLALITLVSAAFVTVVQTIPPAPLPANAPATEFSADRAIEHIRVIAARPRLTGTPAYDAARNYVLAELEKLGLETETQRSDDLQNTIGWIKGNSSSSDIVLLTAHLDSVADNVGATDDGSGVVVLLETARALTYGEPLRNTVMFLFTDHEEGGFFGAKAFIAQHPRAKDVKLVIGFDAGGRSGPGVLSATSDDNGWLIRQLAQADPYFVGSSAINALADSSTDFGHGFKVAGFSGYAFDLYWDKFDLGWESPIYSVPQDNIESINPSSIQHQGYHALSLARHFGNLDQLNDPKEPDAVYFSILRMFTVDYSSISTVPLAVVVAGVFGSVVILGLRRRVLTLGGIGYGLFVLLVGLAIAPLPSILLEKWIPSITFTFVSYSIDQSVVVSIAVLLTLALITLWYFVSRRIRRTSLFDLTVGALVPLLIGSVVISIAFPTLSFVLIWPMLFSLVANMNWLYWYSRRRKSKTVVLGLLLSGAMNTIILGPTILLGLFDQMPLTLVLLGVLCGFLVPQIHLMLGNNIENLE